MTDTSHTSTEQSVAAPTRLGPPGREVPWFWVEAQDSEPGFWTDDHIEADERRRASRVVLQAVDGHTHGIEGCAHRADVMRLTARVWGLELALGALLDELGEFSGLAGRLASDLPGRPDGADEPRNLDGSAP